MEGLRVVFDEENGEYTFIGEPGTPGETWVKSWRGREDELLEIIIGAVKARIAESK